MQQRIVKERGSLNRGNLTDLMAQLGVRRPLLVCSQRMQADFLARTGLEFPLFCGYHANPDLVDAVAGVETYRAHGCDGLISVGGGSAMDTAKAVKAFLCAGDMELVKASRLPGGALPHIAVPGTAGTGAEATPMAVVYVDGEKLSLDHPALLPDGIILDAALLDTLPLYHKKACAMDALCQGIESYWAAAATQESRIHAERAITGVLRNMDAYLAGDAAAADAVLEAAYESGCAIRISRTTAAHAMSYQITKRIGPAHGHACMLTLPHLWRHMGEAPVLIALNTLMGVQDGAELLLGLLAATDMLPDAQPDDATLDALTASVNVQRLGNHPQKLATAELRDIYVQAFTPITQEERARLAALWRAMQDNLSLGAQRFIQAVTEFIFVEDTPESADVIFVPGSRKIENAIRAAELYKAGYAPYVLPSGRFSTVYGHFKGVPERYAADYPDEYETEWAFLRAVLIKHGVPEKAILREDQATYTWENAQFSRDVLKQHAIPCQKAILCCHAFHARRALLYYSAAMPETRFIVCPAETPGYTRQDWFMTEKGRSRVLGEVQRLGSQTNPQFEMMLDEREEKPVDDR